mmetsp:Transcript_21468/g.35409  ORF Transcript_21468/g.35409 Transcript_21468/m.35409 type:complete len:311 (+) Transcript_21468:2561-3493(+)
MLLCDGLGNLGQIFDVFCLSIDGSHSHTFTRSKLHVLCSGKCRRGLGISILRVGNDVLNRTLDQTIWLLQCCRETEYLLGIIHNREQIITSIHEGNAVMPCLFNLNRRRIRRLSRHAVKGKSKIIIGMIHSHPTFKGTSNILQSPLQPTTRRFHLGQTIQRRKSQIIIPSIGNRRTTDKSGKVFFGHDKVIHRGGNSMNIINLQNFHLIRPNIHGTIRLTCILYTLHLGIGRRKRLDQKRHPILLLLVSTSHTLHKGTEPHIGGNLIRLIGRIKLHNWEIFTCQTKRCQSLSTVDIKGPYGLTKDTGDAG